MRCVPEVGTMNWKTASPAAVSGSGVGEPPSSVNVAVPVGTPAPGATGDSVAVTLIVWFGIGLAGSFERERLVDAWLTVWVSGSAEDAANLLSPLKVAPITCVPT